MMPSFCTLNLTVCHVLVGPLCTVDAYQVIRNVSGRTSGNGTGASSAFKSALCQ
jgi:hypothetical protein